jgi:hypothetical protein
VRGANIAVVDNSVLMKVDKRDRPPRIAAQTMLEREVAELGRRAYAGIARRAAA